jgi:hypothetical protein
MRGLINLARIVHRAMLSEFGQWPYRCSDECGHSNIRMHVPSGLKHSP